MKKIVLMMVAALTALSFTMVAGAAEPKKEDKPAAEKKAEKKGEKKAAKKGAEKKPAKEGKQMSGC